MPSMVGAIRLNVHTYGDGAPVVCLHGLTGHGERFARLAERLPGRRVVAPDLRGHGRSTYDPPWTTEQHVQDVLDSVDVGRFDLLGFSYGGRIATALAGAVPERVGRLVLLDPALHVAPYLARENADTALEETVYATAAELIADRDDLVSTPAEYLEEDFAAHYVDGRPRVHRPMAVTAWSEMARPAPPRPAGIPVLLVTGARSWLPVDASALAPTEHVEVPGGHSVLWDDLPLTAEAVARFLR